MKKLLSLSLVACISLFAATDKEIEQFIQTNYKKNPGVTVKTTKIYSKEKMANGFEAVRYFVELGVPNAPGGSVKMADIVFVKDSVIAPELYDVNGKNYKDDARPKLPATAYKDSNFVFGSKNAKYKIVIFSDPFCPFCRDVMPDLLALAEKNPQKVGLWYYPFPLTNIHPAAEDATKAEYAIGNKVPAKELIAKLYKIDINPKETDVNKILAAINKEFNTKLTPKDLSSKAVMDKYNADVDFGYQMIIRGTPTIYINNEFDNGLAKTQDIMKELNK